MDLKPDYRRTKRHEEILAATGDWIRTVDLAKDLGVTRQAALHNLRMMLFLELIEERREGHDRLWRRKNGTT